MEGVEKSTMNLNNAPLLRPVELNENHQHTLFKFNSSSKLKSFVISKTGVEKTYYSLAEILAVLKDVIRCEGIFNPNNPSVILWAKDLEETFYMRALHVMDIRDFVLSHLAAVPDQSSREKFAQQVETCLENITELTKIKTKDECRPPKSSKFLRELSGVPSTDPKKNVFTYEEAEGMDRNPEPLDSSNGLGGPFEKTEMEASLLSGMGNNEKSFQKRMDRNKMGGSLDTFEKAFSLPSCLSVDPSGVIDDEKLIHKIMDCIELGGSFEKLEKAYNFPSSLIYYKQSHQKVDPVSDFPKVLHKSLIWTFSNYQKLPVNLQICLELTYMMKITALLQNIFHLIMVAMDFWTGKAKSKFKKLMIERDENVSNLGIGRCVAGLVQHLQQIANDIEVNPGPISSNIRWMEIFLRFDFNVRKEYTKKLLKNIKDLYEDFVDGKIAKSLYTEENLNTIQDILEFCITEQIASEPKDQIEQLQTNWYEKVRDIERSAAKRPLTDHKDETICILGNGKGTELPKTKRPRSSYEEVKQSAHYACPLCQKAFKRKYGCEKHIKEMHPYGGDLKAQYTIPLSENTDAAAMTIPDDELVDMMNMTGQFNLPTPEYQVINGDLFTFAQLASDQEPQPHVDPNFVNGIYQENA